MGGAPAAANERLTTLVIRGPSLLPPHDALKHLLGKAAEGSDRSAGTPGLHRLVAHSYDFERARGPAAGMSHQHRAPPHPGDPRLDHYFNVTGRNFALDDAAVTESLHKGMFEAFAEDVWALGNVQAVLEDTPPEELYEMSVRSDMAAVAMRRRMKTLAMEERKRSTRMIA